MNSTSGYSHSPSDAELMLIFSALAAQSPEFQKAEINRLLAPQSSEGDKDATRKRKIRSESARIEIQWNTINWPARRAAIADPVKFLMTYFAGRYSLKFGPHHLRMIDDICNRARHGGRQAIAAPRGCGKSELVKGLLVYLVLAEWVRFPLAVAATDTLARRLFRDFRNKLSTNALLLRDFPEVCGPIKELDGAPQRAARQHIDGVLTEIVWTSRDYVRLPTVAGSPFGGVKMCYFGLDAAFRGINIDGDRPDFVIVDDPETKESANSEPQIEGRGDTLDKDIAGLAGQTANLAIALLTTVQNAFCLSFQLTDRKIKPAWNGHRFGMVIKWPERMDLWDEYISIRHANQTAGDEHGVGAIAYYLANKGDMDAGVEMLSDHFVEVEVDGSSTVYSAIQQAFNKIADTSLSAYKSEYQNDPEPEEQAEVSSLTPGRVAGQLSRLTRGVITDDLAFSFVGIDIGKYKSHWVKIRMTRDAVLWITDYGVVETYGLTKFSSERATELAITSSLIEFADTDVFKDSTPTLTLVDSGDFTESIYEFCQQAGSPFFSSKGWSSDRFHQKKNTDEYKPFLEAYAHSTIDSKRREIWLYHVNTEYWKKWGQERFLVDAFLDDTRLPGSVALFEPPHGDKKYHLAFSRHIVSESEQLIPIVKKLNKRVWIVHDKANNHWLDAYALACAAAGCSGLRIVNSIVQPHPIKPNPPQRKPVLNQHGQPFLATER